MFTRSMCLMLVSVLLLSATPVFAAGPLADSVQRLGQASAQQQPTPHVIAKDDGTAMFWSGLTMLGAGATLEILSYTSLKHEASTCLIGYYGYACAWETSTNTPVLITGLVVTAVGGVMTDIGWKKMHPMITSDLARVLVSVWDSNQGENGGETYAGMRGGFLTWRQRFSVDSSSAR